MEHILNTLSPYTQVLLILGLFCYAITLFFVERASRRWKRRLKEEIARREVAETANKAKAFFLTSMSHEIRAPLNAIIGFTEIALKTPLNPELRECLSTVRTSGDWLAHVIKEILDYSRMEAGAFHLCIESFSVHEIVRSAISIAQPLAEKRKLALRLHLDPEIPEKVQGDGARLLQVMFNLIENGIKFTTAGSILVSVVLEHHSGDHATLRFSVADTGAGIAADRLQGLFEPLLTVASPLDRKSRTCGFGLPICQRVIQMMGSQIQVQSRPGMGSTFFFTLVLPCAVTEANVVVRQTVKAPSAETFRILVADDQEESRTLATLLLQNAGHIVTEAATGLEAVQLFTSGHFELVLMDIEMPDFNGVEAAQAIRATEPGGQRTPIYALTAHTSEAERNRCLQAGMTGFLAKPFCPETLRQLTTALLQAQNNEACSV